METADADELWSDFRESGAPSARDRLVVHYSPLVKFVAGRYRAGLPSWVDQDDLLSDGVMGLMDAIDKFDTQRGLKFQTYAVPRIRGAIADGLRSADWVPRGIREKIRAINEATAACERRLGRRPLEPEVAVELGITVAELRQRYSQCSYASISSLESDSHPEPERQGGADRSDADPDLPAEFLPAVRRLPEREQVVIALYYWERLSLAEIGLVLGVSESRVSQLMTRATLELRRTLAA